MLQRAPARSFHSPYCTAARGPQHLRDMEKFEQKMKAAGLSEAAIGAFRLNYEQLVAGVTGLVRAHDSHKRVLHNALPLMPSPVTCPIQWT